MFTGIIRAIASLRRVTRRGNTLILQITCPRRWRLKPGDSVAVNGVCLTVESVSRSHPSFALTPETLAKTTFGSGLPAQANLERSLRVGDELGGHFVFGHVDATGKIARIVPMAKPSRILDKVGTKSKSAKMYTISFPKKFGNLIAPKGSVAVDGVSLTVVRAGAGTFTASLVPYTLAHTTLGFRRVGGQVNLEFDMMAKYAAKQSNYSKF